MNDQSPSTPDQLQTVAAVDLGSNSFHMIVANVDENGHLQVIDRLREMVRLAAGLDKKKNLTPEARERALNCLSRFGQRVKSLPVGAVRAVGTNTLRQVRDSESFLIEAQAALGHPIDIIAGREEARLVYLGVAHGLATKEEKRLVVDIGGGSTELIVGEGFSTLKRESLHMGCVSMSLPYFPDGEITSKGMKKAETAGALEIRPVKEKFRNAGWTTAVGSSGTIRAIRKVVQGEGWSEQGITYESLKILKKEMVKAGHVDNLDFADLSPERRPVFAGGVAVLLSVFKALKIDMMRVSDEALREGLLYDMMGRIRQEDIRDRTVATMVSRYSIDEEHAHRVENTALAMLNQVRINWSLNLGDVTDMLSWSSRLHEVGLAISHSQYQKHGGYILAHADMSGFSRQEQSVLAALVRGHRRKIPMDVFEALPKAVSYCALHLCVLLRMSVLLHRSRSAINKPDPLLTIDDNVLTVTFPDDWLEQHPLTQAELKAEAKRLKPAGIKLKY